jgi:hypothetical protein
MPTLVRHFNTAGPCKPGIHYMLPPLERLPQVVPLIEQWGYFVIHAPRQTGKTTAILALAQQLTAQERYAALWLSVEEGAPFGDDIAAAEHAILDSWYENAEDFLPPDVVPSPWNRFSPGKGIHSALREWAKRSPRPLVIFIDEIDALQGQTLISVLRQLRAGYPKRPELFPQSVALIGLRDVRDYKAAAGGSVQAADGQENRLNTSSPFNIKVESLTLKNFTLEEVTRLYAQHTEDTGQVFTPEAVQLAYDLTQGQPWLVNALARQVVEVFASDRSTVIEPGLIDAAKERLIQRRDTHIDSLATRLQESRVKAIIQPMLAGQELTHAPLDDREFLIDLGLVKRSSEGGLQIANPIYKEVLARILTLDAQDSLPVIQPVWLTAEGKLDPERLLDSFLVFWRQHGQPLLRSVSYHEIAPHLVLMAFLHRVANGGGTLDREYAIGSDRMDLCLRYGEMTLALELKVWRAGRPDPLTAGLSQLDRYLAGLSLDTGWLVIFDQRPGLGPIGDRTTTESAKTESGRRIIVIRG